jgi:hypothetical protein
MSATDETAPRRDAAPGRSPAARPRSLAHRPNFCEPGHSTAVARVLEYRLAKIAERGLASGVWLDVGCGDGHYTRGLVDRGARMAIPFADERFDGVLLNEVLEHVDDEEATLADIARVLRPGGRLVLFSPNRWFPFEGHGARWSESRTLFARPVPLMPWLPSVLTRRFATARNYWPHQLRTLVTHAGLLVEESAWGLAQFEQYPWLPRPARNMYWRNTGRIERSPVARLLAVSTLIVARKP